MQRFGVQDTDIRNVGSKAFVGTTVPPVADGSGLGIRGASGLRLHPADVFSSIIPVDGLTPRPYPMPLSHPTAVHLLMVTQETAVR
jgi:hypothetical protein